MEIVPSAVTHRPASQQASAWLQCGHITTRQFFSVNPLPTFCAQRSRPSLRCGALRSQDVNAEKTLTLQGSLFVILEQLNSICAYVFNFKAPARRGGDVLICVAADWGIFLPLTHNIGLDLINLSPLLPDHTRDESSDGLDLLSEGRLSLKDGIYLD